MVRENYFSRTMMTKTDEELQKIVLSVNEYSNDAIDAATWEIENRAQALLEQEQQALVQEESSPLEEAEKATSSHPRIYSEMVLIVFGILFSVLASGILMAINLVEIRRKTQAMFAIVFSLAFIVLQGMLLQLINIQFSTFLTVPLSIIGVMLLQNLIWAKEYPKGLPFVKRKPWIPLLIGFLISLAMVALVYHKMGMLPINFPQ